MTISFFRQKLDQTPSWYLISKDMNFIKKTSRKPSITCGRKKNKELINKLTTGQLLFRELRILIYYIF